MSLQLAILRAAALLVPEPQRAVWMDEWRSELWYIERNSATFCLGAFRDALWVRSNQIAPRATRLTSPGQCILFLSALAAACLLLAFFLPLPRALLLPSPYRDARNLVMLTTGFHGADTPTVRLDQYQSLIERTPYRFSDLAFYSPIHSGRMAIAMASSNLFDLLRIAVPAHAGARLVLTHDAWRNYYHSDPHLLGRTVNVAGRSALVAAIIPSRSWALPGSVDAWLLEDRSELTAARGFVLARLTTPAPAAHHFRFEQFDCASLEQEDLPAYLAATLVSFVLLSVTTTVSLGEYPAKRTVKPRRWLFLGLKVALLLPIVCCGSLDLSSLIGRGFQAHGLIIGSIIAVRWALSDQRRRCPVCLRVLTSPTRIGGPSHVFLDWYGTELICAQGHGLLYVPEIPTSCYSTQRWQDLDASWSTLFS